MSDSTQTAREWHLSEDEEKIVLATAKLNKARRIEWLNRDLEGVTAELTEEEKQQALNQANRLADTRLFFRTMRNENRKRERLERERVVAEWTASKFYAHMRSEAYRRARTNLFRFEYTPDNEKLIKAICYRLSGDPRYHDELGLNLHKGLIIRGPYGVGKSYLISLVAENPVCPVQIIGMPEITRSVKETGDFTGVRFGKYSIVYLDDIGKEFTDGAIKHYGGNENWFRVWFEDFYSKSHGSYHRLWLSTNDNFDQLEKKYGGHIRDRMRECFDILTIEGESLRK